MLDTGTAIGKHLNALASEINKHHRDAIRHADSALRHAKQCGELLLAAKDQCKHGTWLSWLESNCEVSARQAQRYMKVAESWKVIESKNDAASYLTIDEAIESLKEPTPSKWINRIKNLPDGRLLYGDFKHGWAVIFQSSKHRGYYHFQSYLWSESFFDSEVQETRRPMSAEGLALLLERENFSHDDFTEHDDDGAWEHDIKSTLPASRDFYRQVRGVA